MASISIPYLKLRNGRPRWEPGPGLRGLGLRGVDLKDGNGVWLDEAAAIARARELNAVAAARQSGGIEPRRRRGPERPAHCCAALWEACKSSPRWDRLAAQTRADYDRKASVWLAEMGDRDVAALRHHHLYGWWQELYRERGHAMANSTLAVVRLALSYALKIGWLTVNPALKLGLDGVAPRCIVWSPSEIEALVAAADRLALPSVGDAVVIALHTGQRQGDVLALTGLQIDDGRIRFKQAKRGARVSMPVMPQIVERIEAIERRRRAADVVSIAGYRLIVPERGGSYTRESFGKVWRQVRAEAAREHPGCAAKLFLDLRDTAVTRLALAGCTVPEIRAVTGHSMQTIHTVLQHYLALDDRMAAAGFAKLRTWMDQEGIAV
ncbi:MAG: tyrosine-type recombinase/integrase [Hyphomicrobiaceae bacterium]